MEKVFPYVVSNTPTNNTELALISTKSNGVDIIIPKASVEEKFSILNDYTKFIINGKTDRGDLAKMVIRTSDTNSDELVLLELSIAPKDKKSYKK